MIWLLLSFLGLVALGCPVVFALGASSVLALVLMGDVPLELAPQRMFTAVDSFSLLAIPLFMLAGRLMSSGGVARRLFRFAECLVGHIRGGLGHVNVVASMFFGGMSGAAVADAAGLGAIEVPAMVERGYDLDFTAAVTAASSTVGPVIPPSVPMIVFGCTAGVSVGKLFLGGAIPGVLMGVLLMGYVYWVARNKGYPVSRRATLSELWSAFRSSFFALLTPLIILGGILAGVFTATEAAVAACVYTLVVSMFVYKEFSWRDLPGILAEVAVDTSTVTLIIGSAAIFAWLLSVYQVPALVTDVLLSVTANKWVVLLVINLVLLVVGCFLNTTAALILLVPVILPVALRVGIDPVHLGVVCVVNLCIGMLTPPVGVVLFVTSNVAKIPVTRLIRALGPALVALLAALALVTYIPQLSTLLPQMVG